MLEIGSGVIPIVVSPLNAKNVAIKYLHFIQHIENVHVKFNFCKIVKLVCRKANVAKNISMLMCSKGKQIYFQMTLHCNALLLLKKVKFN